MSARKKALLIDDDSAVTDYLQLKLGATFDVVALNDSTQALSVARRERPDVIVCDIDMPAMDGGDVCRALADAAETRDIPFLYLTSIVSREESDVLDGQIGGRPGVSKHATIEDIVARIQAVMAR
ncbi:MAG: response regulator [Betaproteobacteria bacterium]|nr:MAG: response regulator [Betaproteobacteria bacterium]TMH28664.1 MAG: response regulator [Betaproteobacteria bacterium]